MTLKNRVLFQDDYFKKTIREYQDYLFAFFRETGQNSVDSGATKVNYSITEHDDYFEIICQDNGSGMSEDVLLNKFLVMGGSYKNNEESVGGFGYAKSIILFCHKKYIVETNDLIINGSYGSFTDPMKKENVYGTKITIHLEKSTTTMYNLTYRLKEWVRNCYLPKVKIYLNDEELKQSEKSLEFNHLLNFGNLTFKDFDCYQSVLWVRLRGMAMFKKEIYCNNENAFEGYVDLNAMSSLDCLTSNRDGLLPNYDRELQKIIQELVNERTKYKLDKMTAFLLNKKEYIKESDQDNFEDCDITKHLSTKTLIKKMNTLIKENDNLETLAVFKEKQEQYQSFNEKIKQRINKVSNEKYPDFFLVQINSTSNDELNKLKDYTQVIKLLNQQRSVKLAEKWTALVSEVSLILAENYIEGFNVDTDGDNTFYGKKIKTGFYFDKTKTATALNTENDEMININIDPVVCFEDKYNLDDLLFLINHELCHCSYKNHSDSHAGLMFTVNKIINRNKKRLNNIYKK